jgi:ABC-type microcin C transport system permease subunit YejB
MQKLLRVLLLFSAIAMFVSFTIVGCAGGPNEKQLQMLEESKAAALAAEEAKAECESEKRELESQLAEAERELEKMKQEKVDVNKRLESM